MSGRALSTEMKKSLQRAISTVLKSEYITFNCHALIVAYEFLPQDQNFNAKGSFFRVY